MADIQSFHTAIEKGGDFMEKVILTYVNSEKIVISMGISQDVNFGISQGLTIKNNDCIGDEW